MNSLTQSLTLMGIVKDVDPAGVSFSVECQSGDKILARVGQETAFTVLRNLDDLDNDRVPTPLGYDASPRARIEKYVKKDSLIAVEGVYQRNGNDGHYDARHVHLLGSAKNTYLFEETHWWLTQTARLADQWLDSLFGDKRNYELDDFASLYRTDLSIKGLHTDDDTQECAVLSRLIYGFSAAYLLSGEDRYRLAAAAGVKFQRDAFRSLSHDGQYCFWAYGRKKTKYGTQLWVPSQAGDDKNSIALYEQIYALAGLANYYRITLDWEVLEDIRRTLSTFDAFFLDKERQNDSIFTGQDGWFSHIDYATLRPELNLNPANNAKKNWNSIGDHIPAYLVNLILSLDPLPTGGRADLASLSELCREMLHRATTLILKHFPDPNPKVPYVNERFDKDWNPDHTYSWQQNRAIIGHNFKISWNLIRVANYYNSLAVEARNSKNTAAEKRNADLAAQCVAVSDKLCTAMTDFGIDQIRGGCFDAVEREPSNGQALEFTWMNTKDFWQQEQAILAYLILYGQTQNALYLDMARRTEAFWNLFFLDRDDHGMYFRVTDNGVPIVDSTYGVRGGHSDASGYHCFELNYLAHIYTRSYVVEKDAVFCMYFKPDATCGMESINVLPDFMPPGLIQLSRISIDGVPRHHFDPNCFQIDLTPAELGHQIVVEFTVVRKRP